MRRHIFVVDEAEKIPCGCCNKLIVESEAFISIVKEGSNPYVTYYFCDEKCSRKRLEAGK